MTADEHNGDRPGLVGRMAGAVTGRVVNTVDPDIVLSHVDVNALVDRVDLDAALARVDIQALLERVDLDALISTVDVDALLARIDVNELIARVDPNTLLARVDPNVLVARLDLDALLARTDIDALVARVDVNALVDKVDVEALLSRVDADALIGRVDLDRQLARVDIQALVQRSGIPDIISESTRSIAASMIDLARRQLVGLDVIVNRVMARLLRRSWADRVTGPPNLVAAGRAPDPHASMSGNYAGPMSRLVSGLIDLGVITGLFTLGVAGLDVLTRALFGHDVHPSAPWGVVALLLWAGVYLFAGHVITGRTIGKALAGLRLVRADGAPPSVRAVFVRTIALPVSALFFAIGFLLVLVQRDNRALHDLLAGTCVVYDWGDRPAEMPGPLADYLHRTHPHPVVP
jgi:uncharacterized RDD family membrane protein YckC